MVWEVKLILILLRMLGVVAAAARQNLDTTSRTGTQAPGAGPRKSALGKGAACSASAASGRWWFVVRVGFCVCLR